MWRGISERLCSLQEMDQQVNDCLAAWHRQQYHLHPARAQKFCSLLRAVKLTIIHPTL